MENQDMVTWLIKEKHMSIRSAKDVLSRYNRVCRMLDIDEFDEYTLTTLQECDVFTKSSMFIKSQLKRSVSLYLEYQQTSDTNVKGEINENNCR